MHAGKFFSIVGALIVRLDRIVVENCGLSAAAATLACCDRFKANGAERPREKRPIYSVVSIEILLSMAFQSVRNPDAIVT